MSKLLIIIMASCVVLVNCYTPKLPVEVKSCAEYFGKTLPASGDKTTARQQLIVGLSSDYNLVLRNNREELDNLKFRADKRTGIFLGTGISGAAAGITATALAAASPANAVWVAVFAGYSAGVNGFQTSLVSEGLSRESIVDIHVALSDEMRKAGDEYTAKYSTLLRTNISKGPEWNDAAAGACVALQNLNSKVAYIPLPAKAESKTPEPPASDAAKEKEKQKTPESGAPAKPK